jgi:hypothetical protein
MERIGRPEDDYREKLTERDFARICLTHGLPRPNQIIPEHRGNESVCYHLDGRLFIAFVICEDIHANVEILSLYDGIKEIPTPRVIAWVEEDPELGVPYVITERCPGHRLDALWKSATPKERIGILEAFGAGTARYHTVSAQALTEHAQRLGLAHRVEHIQRLPEIDPPPIDSLSRLPDRLRRIGIEEDGIVKRLESHFTRTSREQGAFIAPGLVHGEPCAEHFIMQELDTGFCLSGCVDLDVCVADPIGEITSHYVSMLGINPAWFRAFRRGYERFFPFPPNAEERLRLEAVEHDLGNVLWLLNTMETRPEWAFADVWVAGHLRRLEGWLDSAKRIDRALFRQDIGPW